VYNFVVVRIIQEDITHPSVKAKSETETERKKERKKETERSDEYEEVLSRTFLGVGVATGGNMLEFFPMRFSNPISFIRCTFFAILASRSSSNCDKGVVKE
jgi:hypothetical protein